MHTDARMRTVIATLLFQGVERRFGLKTTSVSPAAALCFYRAEDWWTYEVCYQKHVRQFHREQAADGSTKLAVEYSLGVFNASVTDADVILVRLSCTGCPTLSALLLCNQPRYSADCAESNLCTLHRLTRARGRRT